VEAVSATGHQVAQLIEQYRFHEATSILYHFTWGTYCDWYVELAKFVLEQDDVKAQAETQKTAAWALGHLLHWLHPFIPFVSEQLWAHVHETSAQLLISSPWPEPQVSQKWAGEKGDIEWLIHLMTHVRTLRSELTISPKILLDIHIFGASKLTQARLETYQNLLCRLLRLQSLTVSDEMPSAEIVRGAAQGIVHEATVVIPLEGILDLDSERQRLRKSLEKIEKEARVFQDKLGRPDFVNKAPPAVIQDVQARLEEAQRQHEQLTAALARIV